MEATNQTEYAVCPTNSTAIRHPVLFFNRYIMSEAGGNAFYYVKKYRLLGTLSNS